MHILFLSHYFPPEVNAPATRTYEHSKYWVEAGHEVTVISCVPHHPMGVVFPGYKNRIYQSDKIDGITAIKVLTFVTANTGLLKRTLNYFFYMIMAILASFRVRNVDIVISTSPQFFNGLAGYFISRAKRKKWVLEIRDLWPESIVAVGALKRSSITVRFLEAIESFVYRKADHIISVTNSFKDHILAKGGASSAISVIRNGVDVEFFQPKNLHKNFDDRFDTHNNFIASYVGTHGMAHGLEILVEAAEILKFHADIKIVTAGEGAKKVEIEQSIKEKKLDNIMMLGQLPKSEMPLLWSTSDVSLVILRDLDLFKSVIPSKIFESMAMKKPIILGVLGESADIVKSAKCGICIEPGNAEQLAAAIIRLKNNKELYSDCAINGYNCVRNKFDRRALATEYLEVLKQLAPNRANQ